MSHPAGSRRQTSLTGIKPTGELISPEDGGTVHLGNYLGAIRPALELAQNYDSLYFIADYHALTTQRDPEALRQNTRDVAAAWLACGLDPERTLIFRQSHVSEVFELMWVFACVVATGQLERGHAYKDAQQRDGSPNAGIFNYPVLMAADIVLYDADVVPVGADQIQHLELARDIATRVNHLFGDGTVVVPRAVAANAPTVPGTDGRKMSKNYGNAIPLFCPAKQLRKAIMKIQADSTPLEAPKEPEGALVYDLFKLVASEAEQRSMAERLRAGGFGWGHAKQELYETLEHQIAPMRERYLELRRDDTEIDRILEAGAERARAIARRTITRVRTAVGID
ncbi:MAG: tryptophan--tRNA ligase [Myxococcales bacterium]|nr:tryptophan--tRNA ligase [Myxococcales bacterium]MDD9965984.1 tryptophan--tRNA ligase [Myxococcales bacterium]